ncbi:uncharacterized protein BYT42DRAFT_574203 [Radiomyces spectabilis]|uniref:uncharacterized protein n=1 Tax=Radiomyces spectabilis TaxID=64574 RepID=UPI002220649E|nr:uncharacterized protein BYT42DRAFT_574203 [Radiomyces spectabilis]KAI8376319.1 hypothetical protein BYT42DRAFT_574203 [Radiomyces spectabilis]
MFMLKTFRPLYLSTRHVSSTGLPLLARALATQASSDKYAEILAAKHDELKDMDRKEVEIDGQSIMLSRLNGRYYATSNFCTHYGGKLSESPLASDGRVTCKLHGACFNVKTGRVEDAPALDNLNTYEVCVKDDGIYVKADRKALKEARHLPPYAKRDSESKETVVIIGGGASGASAAQKLREENFRGRIRIVSRENYLPIDRIKITKQLGINDVNAITLRSQEFWDSLDIEFQLNTDADSVDTQKKQVLLNNGDKWSYDHLILASGGWPKKLGLEGENLGNVFTMRTLDDNRNLGRTIHSIKKTAGRKPRVVIIGSSFIGMEIAAAISGEAQATVIGKDAVPFTKILGEQIGQALQKKHASKGVQFIMEADVKSFQPKADDPSNVGSVIVDGKGEIDVDAVIVAVGVAPQTNYLSTTDLPMAKDKSLIVDEYFRVKGTDNVYATGDIATFPYQHTGEQTRIEHWGYSENTGRTVAMNIAKHNDKHPFTHIPYFWTVQFGTTLRYAGHAKAFDEVIINGNIDQVDDYSFVGYYAKNNEILAVSSYNKDPVVSYCAELLRIGKMPTAADIRKGIDPLKIPLVV